MGFIKYVISRIPLWVVVTVISLIILTSVAHLTPPPQVKTVVNEGVEQLHKVTTTIRTVIKESSNGEVQHFSKLRSVLFVTKVIFLNNARLNIIFSAPFIGGVFYCFALIVNSWIGRVVTEAIAGTNWFGVFLVALLTPHAYLEFFAYSVAVTESVSLSIHALKQKLSKVLIKQYVLTTLISFIILFIAAVVEAVIIIYF